MSWRIEAEQPVTCSVGDFYSGASVWLQRPNVVNRRLLGAVILYKNESIRHLHPNTDAVDTLNCPKGDIFGRCDIKDVCQSEEYHTEDKQIGPHVLSQLQCVLKMVASERRDGTVSNGRCIVREILPKMRNMPEGLEAVIIDEDNHTMTFCPLSSSVSLSYPSGSYRFQCNPQSETTTKITLHTWNCPTAPDPSPNGVTTPTIDWLKSVLLPKIAQWSEESASHKYPEKGKSLIPLARYCQLYRSLKEKYGEPLVKNWPEATDPHKFVYEDIAIATYLLVLWELEREESGVEKKQSFIDLGCGNGLLVYLLSAEGHPGKGIDLRERKIWRMYGDKANLEVCTLTPSDETLFPDFDWLLGNHSDELTPWIPVMAARSSYATRYFVLPCCSHDFEKKFCRLGTAKSQYRSYLDYVMEIGETMGFEVQEDVMRIPSSKRVCQVGRKRSYPVSKEAEIDLARLSFLKQRCPSKAAKTTSLSLPLSVDPAQGTSCPGNEGITYSFSPPPKQLELKAVDIGTSGLLGESSDLTQAQRGTLAVERNRSETRSLEQDEPKWATGFQPRSAVEHVRNCSLINHDLRALVVETLTSKLLETDNCVSVGLPQSVTTVECYGGMKKRDEALSHGGKKEGEEAVAFGGKKEGDEAVSFGGRKEGDEAVSPEGKIEGDAVRSTRYKQEEVPECRWNRGGRIHLNAAAQLLDTNLLKKLKKEYGGLQTLLRNEHQVFKVQGGYVQLRDWTVMDQPCRKSSKHQNPRSKLDACLLRKTKPCWFYHHHPQGCPRADYECSYAHGAQEQRNRPDFKAVLDCSSFLENL